MLEIEQHTFDVRPFDPDTGGSEARQLCGDRASLAGCLVATVRQQTRNTRQPIASRYL